MTVFGFADPIYAITRYFFGTADKDQPGIRDFMQKVGQWARGIVGVKYPYQPDRALMCDRIRQLGEQGAFGDLSVNWSVFGKSMDIWVDSLINRVDEFSKANPGKRVGVVNVRFENEFKRLREKGWDHYHVMCSVETWKNRLAKSGFSLSSPEVKDTSETLANQLDNHVARVISSQPHGPKLKAIWSDEVVPPPSTRLQNLQGFLQNIAIDSLPE